jgi:hypothetical protein
MYLCIQGRTALHLACISEKTAVTDLLIAHGVDITLKNEVASQAVICSAPVILCVFRKSNRTAFECLPCKPEAPVKNPNRPRYRLPARFSTVSNGRSATEMVQSLFYRASLNELYLARPSSIIVFVVARRHCGELTDACPNKATRRTVFV